MKPIVNTYYLLPALKRSFFTFIILFFSANTYGNNTSCPIGRFLEKAEKIDTENLDSILYQVDVSINEISNSLDTSCLIKLYKSFATINNGQAKYYLVFNALWKALLLAEKASLKTEQYIINKEIARFYGYLKRYEKAEEHFKASSLLHKELLDANELNKKLAFDFFFSRTTMYSVKGDFEISKIYLDSCYQYLDKENFLKQYFYLEVEQGIHLAHVHQYKEALVIFHKALKHFTTNNPSYQGIILYHIGDAHWKLDQFSESRQAYQNAIRILETHQGHLDFLPLVYERLADLNFEIGNHKVAFQQLKKTKELDFQCFDSRSERNSYLMNVQDNFRLYKEKEQKRYRSQELIQLQQKQKLLLIQRVLLIGGLLSLFLLAFTYLKLQRGKIQAEKALNSNLQQQNQEKEAFLKHNEKKNEELITFSNIMSHDLKAPLRNITAFSGLIQKQVEGDINKERLAQFNHFISSSAASMTVLIEDLLLYSRVNLEESKFSNVHLNDLILLVLPAFSYDLNTGNAVINVEELPTINGNKGLLKTVFHNILSNALKYQPKYQPNHKATIDIWSVEEEQQYCIYVQDNGIGIKQDYVDKLFQPFVRFHAASEYSGTGLGMSICVRIMQKHQGHIELDQTDSTGTRFKLTFPKMVSTQSLPTKAYVPASELVA